MFLMIFFLNHELGIKYKKSSQLAEMKFKDTRASFGKRKKNRMGADLEGKGGLARLERYL